MSELLTTATDKHLRWHLLTTVSMASLLIAASALGSPASADDADRPTVWIELGGQLEGISGKEERYAPPFTLANMDKPLNGVSPLTAQNPPAHGFGGEGKISFEPKGTEWVFSAAIRYGRSNGNGGLHQQTSTSAVIKTAKYNPLNPKFVTVHTTRFNDSRTKYSSSHTILDFVAGKDVGLGMPGGSSTLSVGVRVAQFGANSDVVFRSFPDPYDSTILAGQAKLTGGKRHHHSYYANRQLERNFRGVGPSISWDGAAPFIGSPDAGEITFDWGANAAVLFGRQRVQGVHNSTNWYFKTASGGAQTTQRHFYTTPVRRSRTVIVPNLGGFAGVSVRYPNAKLSLGYRADFFFGAMDGGVDARDRQTRGFYGPFATVSVGLGG